MRLKPTLIVSYQTVTFIHSNGEPKWHCHRDSSIVQCSLSLQKSNVVKEKAPEFNMILT